MTNGACTKINLNKSSCSNCVFVLVPPQVGSYVVMNGPTHSSRDSMSALGQISRHLDGLQQWVQRDQRPNTTISSKQRSASTAKGQVLRKLQSESGMCIGRTRMQRGHLGSCTMCAVLLNMKSTINAGWIDLMLKYAPSPIHC